jgi:RNA polymerase sigma-70 factor (ECF subfamily)
MSKEKNSTNTPLQTSSLKQIEAIVEAYYQSLYRFAYSLTKNQHEASDLTQQTFLIYSTKGHTIRNSSKIKSWLFTTLYREFLGQRRKMSRLEDFDTLNIEIEDLTNKNRNIIHKEEKSNVLNALDVIDPIYKEVIVLFYLKDLSYKEVADILTIPIGTVMSRLSRGKKQLKSVLKFKDLASDNTKDNETTSSKKTNPKPKKEDY